ncbi:beta-Ala-His dipeptidase [Brackiella oedipodis]|uniref:beta-Ala-His dipeptidase n=1 Tax=Brackiella oedipodis TaxID=124225 RepID=UPI00048E89FC|nr:beta-Ala-His dipeptidase [Brackiella oedipodis]
MTSSTSTLQHLEPKAVWQWFAKFCEIPHPTYHEAELASYIKQACQQRGLRVEQDAKGNLRISKPATQGLEQAPVIGLQAHIDMVPQKSDNSHHDFQKDPILPRIADGWVSATETTLGADNGIGACMGLALLFADDIAHPPLELILTLEEETGMGGARALAPEWLDLPYLLNLDTEEEGCLYVGCAGGRDMSFSVDMAPQPSDPESSPWLIEVSGLQGGHSGLDIHLGLGNANKILADLLLQWHQEQAFGLVSLQGGTLRNAIPRAASAVIMPSQQTDISEFRHRFSQLVSKIKHHWHSEKQLEISLQPNPAVSHYYSAKQTEQLLQLIHAIPNGVIAESADFDDVVETSISMGVIEHTEHQVRIHCLMRSLLESPKDELCSQLEAIARKYGAQTQVSGDYPGWQPDAHSVLLKKASHIFKERLGYEPDIKVVHAGLECGILKGHAPATDMISFGPNIENAHSPRECVEIDSVQLNWQLLCDLCLALSKEDC